MRMRGSLLGVLGALILVSFTVKRAPLGNWVSVFSGDCGRSLTTHLAGRCRGDGRAPLRSRRRAGPGRRRSTTAVPRIYSEVMKPPGDVSTYLEATPFVDSDAENVVAFSQRVCGDEMDEVAKAVRLYYAVRDGITYTPYCGQPDIDRELLGGAIRARDEYDDECGDGAEQFRPAPHGHADGHDQARFRPASRWRLAAGLGRLSRTADDL